MNKSLILLTLHVSNLYLKLLLFKWGAKRQLHVTPDINVWIPQFANRIAHGSTRFLFVQAPQQSELVATLPARINHWFTGHGGAEVAGHA